MTINAGKCEYLSHLELDEGRKVQEIEEICKTKREKKMRKMTINAGKY